MTNSKNTFIIILVVALGVSLYFNFIRKPIIEEGIIISKEMSDSLKNQIKGDMAFSLVGSLSSSESILTQNKEYSWDTVKKMINNYLDSEGRLEVRLENTNGNLTTRTLIGFKIDATSLAKMVLKNPDERESLFKANLTGVYIMPAQAECSSSTRTNFPYKTMVLGWLRDDRIFTGDLTNDKPFIDFFSPCPKDCDAWTEIKSEINDFPEHTNTSTVCGP